MSDQPFRGLLVDTLAECDVVLTGIPYDEGASCGSGARLAPQRMRELSAFLPPLSKDGKDFSTLKVFDSGDIIQCSNYFQSIEKEAMLRYRSHKFPIFLGGDHSVSIPLQRAFLSYCKENHKIPAIVHLDAHPDICDVYDGSKFSHACTNQRSIEAGYLPQNITLLGLRGFEKQEIDYFQKHPEIEVYTTSKIQSLGVEKVIDAVLKKYDDRYAIYLSYDIDINDPAYAPGTGTPEAFGLTSLEVLKIIENLFQKAPICAFDIVEVSPLLDINNVTSWLALKTLYEVFQILNQKKQKE